MPLFDIGVLANTMIDPESGPPIYDRNGCSNGRANGARSNGVIVLPAGTPDPVVAAAEATSVIGVPTAKTTDGLERLIDALKPHWKLIALALGAYFLTRRRSA